MVQVVIQAVTCSGLVSAASCSAGEAEARVFTSATALSSVLFNNLQAIYIFKFCTTVAIENMLSENTDHNFTIHNSSSTSMATQ